MSSRISVRIDDAVRQILEAAARSRNIPLSTLLNEIATAAARQIKRRRIREQSEAVTRYVASSPEAAEFLEFWGMPRMEDLGRPPKLRSKRDE
jgi:antitoxin component of RelBE/YafQ-DinJ toxin-antitoxin module